MLFLIGTRLFITKNSMCKIAIITNYRFTNYGSALQSYALQTVIKELGYQCENIKYDLKHPKIKYFPRLASAVKNPSRILEKLFRTGRYLRHYKFERFFDQYIDENGNLYKSIDELKSINCIYDAFICGSDQIWAPNQFNEWFYLSFVDDNRKKVAYAPSIGLPTIPDSLKSRMASLLREIKYLSVREKQGADIIKELTGINVPVVLDPTLLISKNKWISIATETKIKREYILCYFLGGNTKHREVVEKYKQKTGYKIIALSFAPCDYSWGDIAVRDAGPLEFVGLINNARVVFTDSFHGAIFSINLNKKFNVFMRFRDEDVLCQNSRIVNILEVFGLSHRLISDDCLEIKNDSEIDYEPVNKILEDKRKDSIDYLKTSLRESVSWSQKN